MEADPLGYFSVLYMVRSKALNRGILNHQKRYCTGYSEVKKVQKGVLSPCVS